MATTSFQLSVPYVVWLALDFATASRPVYDYFDDEDRVSGPICTTEDPVSAIKLSRPDEAPAVPTSASFSLGPSSLSSPVPAPTPFLVGSLLPSSPLSISPQPSKAGLSSRLFTIVTVPVVSALDAPAPTRDIRDSSVAYLLSAIVPLSVGFGVGTTSDIGISMVGRTSTSLVSASSTLSRPCAVVILTGSPPVGTSDAGASDITTLPCHLAVGRRQPDAVCQEFV